MLPQKANAGKSIVILILEGAARVIEGKIADAQKIADEALRWIVALKSITAGTDKVLPSEPTAARSARRAPGAAPRTLATTPRRPLHPVAAQDP